MKNIYKHSIMLAICLMVATGCRKHYEEINTDPSTYNPTNFNPNFLLTGAQLGYTGSSDLSYDTWRANLIYCGTMMQGISSVISYWAGDKYLLDPGYTAAYWGYAESGNINSGIGAYPEQVRLVVDLVAFTKDKPQYKNLHQVSRIMKALIFQRITDLYGDIPYSQAGLGFLEKIYFPVYDQQKDIYTDMLKEVTEAADLLNVTGEVPTGDAIFNGDIAKWKRFGNSLALRLAMRLSKVDPATAQSYVQKLVGKTMLSNNDNAFISADINGGRTTLNRNSQVLQGGGGKESYYTKWSSTFINFLKSNNDPRLGVIAVTNLYVDDETKTQNPAANPDPAVQKGMPNGKDLSLVAGQGIKLDPSYTAFTDYSSPSPALIKGNGPTFILTYAETELLWADAAQRFGIGGSAAQHYRDGVIAAMTYLSQYDVAATVSVAAATAYADAHPYNAADGLNMINTQYWAHNNTKLDFYESWANWRRTGFPVLIPVVYPGNVTNGTIPRRFPYPVTEAGTNTENYNKAVASVPGGDLLTSRVWWDKN